MGVDMAAPYRWPHERCSRGLPTRHNLLVLSLLCFAVGGCVGWLASRGGTRVQQVWPIVLRAQLLVTSVTLSLAAAWRLTGVGQLFGPVLLAGGLWVVFFAAALTRGERSAGES